MAEAVASALVNVIFQKLADVALKKYVGSQGFYTELENLERELSQIQAVLKDAADKEVKDEAVKQWLRELKHLAYDIDNLLDDVATEAMHRELSGASTSTVRNLIIPTCCTNFSLDQRLSHKLDSITTRLEHINKEKNALGLTVKDGKQKDPNRGNETSLPESNVVGRVAEKEELLKKLLGDDGSSKENFSIVPIVGMGGVGKTTLATLLYNDPQLHSHFELRAWVYVSNDFDIFKISKVIFQSVTGENKDFADLHLLQVALKEHLKEKRFLLVLDDVWCENNDDWQYLLQSFHLVARRSKIIITTRKDQLLKKLGFGGIGHLDHLKILSHEDALSLFALHALGVDNFDSHPTLKQMGESIVEKCGGLPLALKAIGRRLRTTTNAEDWDDVLKSEIWDIEISEEIFSSLKRSYHDLSQHLKTLFEYCSLFPRGFLFDKEELILLWMAEGYLNQSRGYMSPERFGHECFEILLSKSFFQHAPNDESFFVMHNLMNDLATFVAEDYFLRFEKEMEIRKRGSTKYHHISFIREEYVAYHKFEAFKRARSLRTMLAVSAGMNNSWDTFYLSNKILVDLLPELALLRVLCLSRFEISEVPEFIGSLKHLRYLNLSQTKIRELPDNVGNLYNLQTLIVFGCQSLTKLPKSFSKLQKLRHFDLRDTPLLEKLPLGIGELESLHTLTKIIIGGDNGFTITELKGLINLHGEISIQGLHKVQSAMHAKEANLSLKRLSKLELKWGYVFDGTRRGPLEEEVISELKPHSDRLKELAIVSYGGTKFPNWIGDPSFHLLTHVSIRGCKKCTYLPPLGQLASLKELFIQGMDEVEDIGSEFTGTIDVSFPSLEVLWFEDMSGWKTWSTNYYILDEVFPCLRELHIKDCPNLNDVLVEALPSLRVLQIDRCGDGVLRHLVHAASSITKLEIQSILGLTDGVWRGVIDYLGTLEELRINGCNDIKYLWESEADASKVLVNLKKLYVHNCSGLVSLGEIGDGDNFNSSLLSSLRILDVWHCNNMQCCCCPNSIESLCIGSCSSVTRVSFATPAGGQKLKSLDISLCNEQMEIINNTGMPMLEYVFIYRWRNLKSITDMSYFKHITHLELYSCLSIETFPDLELSKLTSLQFLLIEKCPSMDSSFPRGLWPPKLVSLGIGGLKKPILEWGYQNFPTSLVSLTLCDEPEVSNLNQLSHLLPSSLTHLGIEEFDNLESPSEGLQHLTHLQHLSIEKCPKMKHLPETLLPSLLSLIIEECPYLEERCNGRGSRYWPLISHIPRIEIESREFGTYSKRLLMRKQSLCLLIQQPILCSTKATNDGCGYLSDRLSGPVTKTLVLR
uniref:Putative NB-ARC n=1 Tax=Helianthus annuus TaxID=4232 RepID=A0A251VKJ0_HELAN